MDIVGAITSVSAAIGLAKELRSIDAEFDKAELKLKIAELTSALADAKMALSDVADQMKAKELAIEELGSMLRYKAENVVDRGDYRYRAKNGAPYGKPLCPICEKSGDFITIIEDRSKGVSYRCPQCDSNFGTYVPVYI